MTMSPDGFSTFQPTGALEPGPTLLEASAGTGKTYSISSLVLRLVAEKGLKLPEILVVTFTRAATSELRERIRRRLLRALDAMERALAEPGWIPERSDDEVIHHLVEDGRERGRADLEKRAEALRRAREEFDNATISTIHGFCQDTLHHSAFESNLDFSSELVEDLTELIEEVTHDFIVRELRRADGDWVRYLRDHSVTRKDLVDLAARIEAEPHVRIIPEYDGRSPAALRAEMIERFRKLWTAERRELIEWLRGICEETGAITSRYTVDKIAERDEPIQAWARGEPGAPTLDELKSEVEYFSRSEIQSRLKGDRIVPHDLVLADECERLVDLMGHPASQFKVQFAAYVREELDRRKRQRNILSFNDLLLKLRDGLNDPDTGTMLRGSIRARFQAALIDEFQDTDPVQWDIFRQAFGDDWLYLIGDPKQAIYAFRGADVREYLKAAQFVDEDAQYTLRTNWRSDQRFVDALNHLLDRDGVFGEPGIRYVPVKAAPIHQEDRLIGPDGAEPTLWFHLFPRSLNEVEGTKAITKGWAGDVIPRQVAAEIAKFLDGGYRIAADDGASTRPVEPRDIAVLVRTNKQARDVQDRLIGAGVPAVTSGGGSVFDSDEATHMQRLLEALLRPSSEASVKAALTTPLFAVTASDLVAMEQDEATWEGWIEQMGRWSLQWRRHGIADALRSAFIERNVARNLLGLERGERQISNVLHLVELLHGAETEERLGPSALSAWLRDQREEKLEANETEIRLESDEEAVQVVTVHRAKGLEFPVVWCPFLWDGNVMRGSKAHVRLHLPQDDQLALDVHVDDKAPPKAGHLKHAEREAWTEAIRLMYVALTRARHRCVVYWGPFTDAGMSPLGHVLHGCSYTEDEDGTPVPPDEKLDLSDDAIEQRLQELAEGSGGTIGTHVIYALDDAGPPREGDGTAHELSARTFTGRAFDGLWGRTSFSALTRPMHESPPEPGSPDAEGEDREQHADAPVAPTGAGLPAPPPVTTDAAVPLAEFPRGVEAGTFLHGVLEDLDFTRADERPTVEAHVQQRATRHGMADDVDDGLVDALQAVLATPLGPLADGATLQAFAPIDRLNELRFHVPVAGGYRPIDRGTALDLRGFADVMRAHAGASPIAGAYADHMDGWLARQELQRPTRGFMTGAIDLVVRHRIDGEFRYFLVDHKSNWLGDRRGDGDLSTVDHYHPAALAREMVSHDYVLQYHIYSVALHRFLRWRLGDGYDYGRHFGGALYLFLRGMIGPDTPTDDSGQPHGVFADRPPRGLVEDLDELLANPATRGGAL